MELDGEWPHVDVDLIPQSVKDNEVIVLQSDIPVQTSPPHESKRYFKEVPKVKCDGDFQSLQDILSRTKEARHYGDNTTGIFCPIAKTACCGIGQKERSKVVGNIEFLPFQSAGHSKLSASCAEVSHSASIGTFGSSFKFPSVSMNPFGNITESSLMKEQLFGHSSKIATTASPNISPIIDPSRLILSNSPQVWRSTPPAKVSNVELEAVQRTISMTLKISDKTDIKQYRSMPVASHFQEPAKHKKSFVKKVAKALKTKSQKLREKLRSLVVRPATSQKQCAEDEQGEETFGEITNDKTSNEVLNFTNLKESFENKEDAVPKEMQKFDENSPKVDLMLSQKSKKSIYPDINIENDTDSSMKGNTEDVSNRSLSEIFEDKEMFDSSQDSHDPFNILKSAKLPSDLDSVSPIIFSALGSEIGSQAGNGRDINSSPEVCKSNVISDTTEKGTVEVNSKNDESDTYVVRNVELGMSHSIVDQNPTQKSTMVTESIEISDISQEDLCKPAKNDNSSTQYFALPGNKDTIMVEFPTVTGNERITPTESNELNNIAQQYASKEDVADQNSEENQDNEIGQSSDNVQSTSHEVSKNVKETFIQPIANGKQMLLEPNGQLKTIVYEGTFTGENITSVMQVALSGSKLQRKIDKDIVDQGDHNYSTKVLDKSTTESTFNEGDNSTEITESSEPTTNSTTTESNLNTDGHENTMNNTESGEPTSNDEIRQHQDIATGEQLNEEANANQSDASDEGMVPAGEDFSNDELLLGSQSDNPEVPIDPAREKALLDDSSSNSHDELSKVTSNKRKKALLSSKARNLKRKHAVNIISSDGKYHLTFLAMKTNKTLH